MVRFWGLSESNECILMMNVGEDGEDGIEMVGIELSFTVGILGRHQLARQGMKSWGTLKLDVPWIVTEEACSVPCLCRR